MEKTGLFYNIISATANIDYGRKSIATRGKAEEGRISYEDGIAEAMAAFQQAQATADPQTIIMAEYTFLTQELEFCEKSDKESINSLSQALKSFDDAFLALQAVEEDGYKTAEKTYPHHKDYRFGGYPKDSFHIACYPNKNIIRAKRINPMRTAT